MLFRDAFCGWLGVTVLAEHHSMKFNASCCTFNIVIPPIENLGTSGFAVFFWHHLMVLDRPDSDAGNAQKQKKILFFSESGALKFVGDLAVRLDSLNSDHS